jgi:predicted HicB family RNase H-like nuclease
MKPVLEYKGYLGSAEVSIEDGVVHGKLLYINDVVSYAADSPREIEAAFREAVADYLETCADCGDTPDTPFKGNFNVRLGPELHRACALAAERDGIKLNEWVRSACQAKLVDANRRVEQHHHIKVVFENQTSFELEQTPMGIRGEASRWQPPTSVQ